MKLIVDANVLTSAALGRSNELILSLIVEGVELSVPERMFVEAQKIVAERAATFSSEATIRLARLGTLLEIISAPDYLSFEGRARTRLSRAGQSDWPLIATALAFDCQIWSNDKHLCGVGIAVWSTINVARVLAPSTGANDA